MGSFLANCVSVPSMDLVGITGCFAKSTGKVFVFCACCLYQFFVKLQLQHELGFNHETHPCICCSGNAVFLILKGKKLCFDNLKHGSTIKQCEQLLNREDCFTSATNMFNFIIIQVLP